MPSPTGTATADVPLARSEDQVAVDFGRRFAVRGGCVLEIGGNLTHEVVAELHPRAWISLDPRAWVRPGHRVVGRAESVPVADGSVDAVFSCNAVQFIDVERMLAECRRVLRPGGVLYAHFGPIWSGPDGHQLEYVSYRGRDLVFWRDTLLPPYAHLLYDRDELRALLRSGLEPELADLLVWHVHDSPTVNRLFFEDYVELALRSGLDWVEVAASRHLDYDIAPPAFSPAATRPLDVGHLERQLAARHGAPRRLGVRDVRMVLRRPPPD